MNHAAKYGNSDVLCVKRVAHILCWLRKARRFNFINLRLNIKLVSIQPVWEWQLGTDENTPSISELCNMSLGHMYVYIWYSTDSYIYLAEIPMQVWMKNPHWTRRLTATDPQQKWSCRALNSATPSAASFIKTSFQINIVIKSLLICINADILVRHNIIVIPKFRINFLRRLRTQIHLQFLFQDADWTHYEHDDSIAKAACLWWWQQDATNTTRVIQEPVHQDDSFTGMLLVLSVVPN